MHLPRPSRHVIRRGRPCRYQFRPARVLARPLRQPALPQIILIVQPQFLQAGARHVRELEFRFLGRAARLAALRDVLHARTRRLHHLVVGAAALLDVPVAETHRHIVGQLRHLKAFQLPVAAMQRNQFFRLIHNYPCQSVPVCDPIARFVSNKPGQIQRTITGLPFKFPDRLVNFTFHALNSISLGATKAVQRLSSHFQFAPPKGCIRRIAKMANNNPTNTANICPCHAIELAAAGRGNRASRRQPESGHKDADASVRSFVVTAGNRLSSYSRVKARAYVPASPSLAFAILDQPVIPASG